MKEFWFVEFNRNSVLTFIDVYKAVLGVYQEKVIETTETLIGAGERTGLIYGKENTKLAKVSRQEYNPAAIIDIQINQYTLQCVDSFKYPGILINSRHDTR